MIASGPAIRTGAEPGEASLLDVAPTVLHLLGVRVPDDVDGRVLTELFDQEPVLASPQAILAPALAEAGDLAEPKRGSYSEEEDSAIKQRLVDLGYL